jgi:hypothetical protein
MLLFDNISEAQGQKIAVNMLTRDRLCEAIGIQPDVYIDTLAWAMKNPSEPVIVSPSDAPVYDCMQDEVDLFLITGHKIEGDTCLLALLSLKLMEGEI